MCPDMKGLGVRGGSAVADSPPVSHAVCVKGAEVGTGDFPDQVGSSPEGHQATTMWLSGKRTG